MKNKITTHRIAEVICATMQLELKHAIVLMDKSAESHQQILTVTIPKGNYVHEQWTITITKDV